MEMFDRGDVDLVGVGRALLANPTWSNLVRNCRFDLPRPYDAAALAAALEAAD